MTETHEKLSTRIRLPTIQDPLLRSFALSPSPLPLTPSIPKDPERAELGDTRLTRGGFKSLDEAQRALAEALRKKKSNARFQSKTPTVGEYADHWISGLRLQNSTIEGYRKIVRNHVTPYLGTIRLDKLTATRIASHYRQLETSGRRDKPGYGKPLSANTASRSTCCSRPCSTPPSMMG